MDGINHGSISHVVTSSGDWFQYDADLYLHCAQRFYESVQSGSSPGSTYLLDGELASLILSRSVRFC